MRFLLFLAALFSFQVGATGIDFKCQTKPATTSFTLTTKGDQVVLTTLHANGTDFMPVHEGIIVPHDFPYLMDAASRLKHIGMKSEFRFPLARCKTYAPGVLTCAGGEKKTIDGVEMEALNVLTKRITTQVFDDTVTSIKVTLDVKITGFVPVQEITMEYGEDDCQFGL